MTPCCSSPLWVPSVFGMILALLVTSCQSSPACQEGDGYLIIVPEAVSSAVASLADYKRSRGFLVKTALLEDILDSSPGSDSREKIRNYLAEYAGTTAQAEFVLLVGSHDTIPMLVAWIDRENFELVLTDFYYEDAIGDWDRDGDGYLGEYVDDMQQGNYDYEAELRVGRLPFGDPETIATACDAFIRFDQDTSERMHRAMTASQGFFFSECETALVMRLVEEQILSPSGYSTTSLYSRCPGLRPDYELNMDNFLAQWEERQPGFVAWVAHGDAFGTSFMNLNHLPQGVAPAILAAVSCSICDPIAPSSLGGLLVGTGTCASILCATHHTSHGTIPLPVLLSSFEASVSLVTERHVIGDAKARFIESYLRREWVPWNMSGTEFHKNILTLVILGEPSLRLR